MRARQLLLILLLSGFFFRAEVLAADRQQPATEDPILLSKQIIAGYPEHWSNGANNQIFKSFKLNVKLKDQDWIYQLLESPGLTLNLEGQEGQEPPYFSKEALLELLKNAVVAPETTSRQIARATLEKGLEEYNNAYTIAISYQNSQNISLEDAIAFLDNRYGYAKLEDARTLMESASPTASVKLDNKKIRDKLKSIDNGYPEKISLDKALTEVYDFYRLMEEERIGLAAFTPYIRFKEVMEELNKSRIAQRRKYRSSITISKPDGDSVWELNDPVSLEWSTINIPTDKSLRFFLVKGEMVVQELGTFKNKGDAKGMHLNKNIDSGEDYRVVGIELFPANKYYVAKIATPNFSIRRPARKTQTYHSTTTTKEIAVQSTVPPVSALAAPDSLRYERMSFEGRKISYVKELSVDATDIRISIWDHGRQDDDIVSIYLNGEPVVSKHHLTYRKAHFDVHLDPTKKNDLFVYAHNLGYYPPNTVSIEIIDNSSSENIVLNSDLKSCEAVLINVDQ